MRCISDIVAVFSDIPLLRTVRRLWCAGLCLAVVLAAPFASASPTPDYQPYTPAESQGGLSTPLSLVLAYSAIWLVVVLFVVSVWRRQRRVEGELVVLRQRLAEAPPPARATDCRS